MRFRSVLVFSHTSPFRPGPRFNRSIVVPLRRPTADTGKLVLTGGVSSITGSAGGGITPWAVIGTQATEGELGFSAYATRAATQDYSLSGYGVALGLYDRLELSLARQDFDASPAVALNGIAPFGVLPGQHIRMDVLGLKLRVVGDAVLDPALAGIGQVEQGLAQRGDQPARQCAVARVAEADTARMAAL